MLSCNWCGKKGNLTKYMTKSGEEHELCQECIKTDKKGVCRICGDSIEDISIKGMCIVCSQVKACKEEKERLELEQELKDNYSGVYLGEQSEDSFLEWLYCGYKKIPKEIIEKNRLALLKIRLKKEDGWTDEIISKNVNNLLEIANKYKDKVLNGEIRLIYKNENTMKNNCFHVTLDRIDDIFIVKDIE